MDGVSFCRSMELHGWKGIGFDVSDGLCNDKKEGLRCLCWFDLDAWVISAVSRIPPCPLIRGPGFVMMEFHRWEFDR